MAFALFWFALGSLCTAAAYVTLRLTLIIGTSYRRARRRQAMRQYLTADRPPWQGDPVHRVPVTPPRPALPSTLVMRADNWIDPPDVTRH